MGFWDFLTGAGATPNATVSVPDSVGPTYNPGDPHGVTLEEPAEPTQQRAVSIVTSPWDGYPASWATPAWSSIGGGNLQELTDVAWAALDLNSSVLSAMPPYRTRGGGIMPPTTWMGNPDPEIYTDWSEFAKQLFWEFQIGEAFVLPFSHAADGWPYNFRVIPQPLVTVEMEAGRRVYHIGSLNVTDEILHIRYKSSTDTARGIGPLESGRSRIVHLSMLARYAQEIANGAIPKYIIEVEARLSKDQARDLLDTWWESRVAGMGDPAKPGMLTGGAKAHPLQLTPEQMALTEQTQLSEARIAVLLGVPPFLLGLPTNESMTYSNVSQVFDFHDRRCLKPMATRVMQALSGWALPRGQAVELNRDEYSRPSLSERAEAYAKLIPLGVLSSGEVRMMERLVDADMPADVTADGEDGLVAAEALTGGGRS